jgi:hypothetical protein
LQKTIRESFEKDAARIEILEKTHELQPIATSELANALIDVPASKFPIEYRPLRMPGIFG